MLATLGRHGAKATFFAIGESLVAQPQLARRIVREGHAIGNHTYNHVDLTRVSAGAFYSEVDRTTAAIKRITGTVTRWLRPPYGAANATTRVLASRRGYRLALWDVDPQDWRRPGAPAITANVLARARDRGIVLFHDGGGDRSQTVAALEAVLPTLRARGYVFRSLPR